VSSCWNWSTFRFDCLNAIWDEVTLNSLLHYRIKYHLYSNFHGAICCGFIVQLVVQQIIIHSTPTTNRQQIKASTTDPSLSRWAALARCGRSGHVQVRLDGIQVSSRPSARLLVWAVHAGRSSRWTTASPFSQPQLARRPKVPAEHVWPSCLCRGCASNLELTVGWTAKPGSPQCHLPTQLKDVSVSTVPGALRRCAIMRYINLHLHCITCEDAVDMLWTCIASQPLTRIRFIKLFSGLHLSQREGAQCISIVFPTSRPPGRRRLYN